MHVERVVSEILIDLRISVQDLIQTEMCPVKISGLF